MIDGKEKRSMLKLAARASARTYKVTLREK